MSISTRCACCRRSSAACLTTASSSLTAETSSAPLLTCSGTLGVIGVGSPEGARDMRRSAAAPRRRSGPSPHPHSRLGTIGDIAGSGARNVCWRPGNGYGERDGRPAPGGPAGESPVPSLLPPIGRRWAIARRRGRIGTRNGRDGRVFHVATHREAFDAVS